MPALRNARQELVAQALASGATKFDAYAAAGYAPDYGNASRLTGKDKVKERVAEIQAGGVELAQFTLATLVAAADEVRELAIEHRQLSAAVSAIKEVGTLTGLRIDRRVVGSPNEFARMSDEELMQLVVDEVRLIELPDDEPPEAR
jgi:hypothetical protein